MACGFVLSTSCVVRGGSGGGSVGAGTRDSIPEGWIGVARDAINGSRTSSMRSFGIEYRSCLKVISLSTNSRNRGMISACFPSRANAISFLKTSLYRPNDDSRKRV